MAKTRIKTTPTRMQKEALMASAAVTTTTNIGNEHVFKKRISVLKNSITAKKAMPIQSTIIVQPPKRTNSISSVTSTISHTSDGGRSCIDSPPPTNCNTPTKSNGPTMAELTENAIKTLNAGLLAKSNALALKNRKVYMITEKYDESSAANSNGTSTGGTNGATTGQKRKMYLIMEEKESDKIGEHADKLVKTENTNGSKKLTLFTDTTNGQLPQKFEKILPEILNCIQAKKSVGVTHGGTAGGGGGGGGCEVYEGVAGGGVLAVTNVKTDKPTTELNGKTLTTMCTNNDIKTKFQLKTEDNERLPLTLPPKKNRTKIITTQIIPVNPTQTMHKANAMDNWSTTSVGVGVGDATTPTYINTNVNNGYCKPEKSSATPVIVNAASLMATNGSSNAHINGLKSKENGNASANQLHKNINLSTDFLFLMKMLPKLESIEEPHKNYVKTCIEDIINQYAANQIVD